MEDIEVDSLEHLRLFGQHFEIVCGTNEEYLIAFTIKYAQDGRFGLHSSFANHSHCSGIRRLAICGQYLISGGTDEMVHVYNLKRRNKMGVIGEHDGTITDLQQHKQKYVFSASEDGKICIFKEGKWECEKRLLGHKGAINSLAIHPTGRLALSVGVDRTLHTWDLVKGKKAYVCTLAEVGTLVKWAPSGERYVVVADSRVDIYIVQSAMITSQIECNVRINDILYLKESVLAVALENGKIALYHVDSRRCLQQWEAHVGRVRTMATMPTIASQQDVHDRLYIVSGSSDGWMKVWALNKSDLRIPAVCVTAKNTQCRITCVTVYADDQYQQAIKARAQDQVTVKSDNFLHRAKKSGSPKNRIKREAFDEEDDEEEECDVKPRVVTKPKKKKKKRQEPVVEEIEEEYVDEEEIRSVKMEVLQGMDALAALSTKTQNSSANVSGRRNRGKLPSRYLE